MYSLDHKFGAIAAVYIFTVRRQKANGRFEHTKVYLGQTTNIEERFASHHKAACIKREGANCVCIHRENSEAALLAIEQDLLAAHKPVCNG